MINYPHKKSTNLQNKDTILTYANRGISFENLINNSNYYYNINDIANIHKKPTPIKVVSVSTSSSNHKITEAYYSEKSTTDYNGIYKSKYLDFEAKSTTSDKFQLSNIAKHQYLHLKSVKKHGGIAFILVEFKKYDKIFLLPFDFIEEIYSKDLSKYVDYFDIINNGNEVKKHQDKLDYLEVVDTYFNFRENNG